MITVRCLHLGIVPRRSLVVAILFGALYGLLFPPAPAAAQAITPESLAGSTIVATVNYDIRWRRNGADGSGPGSVTYRLQIGANGSYSGSVTRARLMGSGETTEPFSGTLAQPREAKGAISGHAVWMLSANTLRMLRTYQVGGKSTIITFGAGGRSCSVRSPFMREVGAGGSIRREAAVRGGGTFEFTSARETSSSCQVTRG